MTIWIVLAAITLLVAGFVLWPVLRQHQSATGTSGSEETGNIELDHDLAVYRDQLAEIDRDIERGVLSTEQANAARIEVQRRILNADQRIKTRTENVTSGLVGSPIRIVSVIAILVFLTGGLGIYLDLGRPDLPDRPIASRADEIDAIRHAQATNSERTDVLNRAVSDLSQKLINDPKNLKGWELLGASLMALGRPVEAQTAFLETVKLSDRDGDYLAMYAESLIRGDNGQINATARGVLKEAATTDSLDPRIGYYLGLADAQDGNIALAVDRWIELVNAAPGDANWVPMVVERINDAALAQGIDIEGRLKVTTAPQMGGPSQDDVAAAQEMTPEDRQQMINGMVDRLAERLESEPNDPDGWARLMQAYMVLGKTDEAQTTYHKAAEFFADQPEMVLRFDTLAREIGIATN